MTGGSDVERIEGALADILCLPTPAHPEGGSRRGRLNDRVIRGAAEVIDASGILTQVQQWREEDRAAQDKGKGGRPALVSERTCLIILLALVLSGEDPLISRVAEVLQHRLQSPSRDLLRLPRVHSGSEQATYHRVHRALRRFIAVIDSAPGSTGRRLTRAEVGRIRAARDRSDQGVKHARLLWVTNTLLEATYQLVPRDIRNRWVGNLAIDATVVPVFGKGGSPTVAALQTSPDKRFSPEFDAGWYHREADHRDPLDGRGRRNAKSIWGYETHLAVMSRNTPADNPDFPLLVLGMSVDKPAGRVAENALTIIQSIAERAHPAGMLVGDRAYFPGAKAEKLQLPVRELGYTLCGDYRNDQLGIQGQNHGALLIEGGWYCPSIPQALIDATRDVRSGTIDEDTYRTRIERRAQYAFRRKDASITGNGVYVCPARGLGATAACPVAAGGAVGLGMPRIRTLIPNPPERPDRCCTNSTSITLADTEPGIAKYRQDLPYAGPEWSAMYSRPRNTIEGYNALAKSPTEANLAEPGRRRIRGRSIQTVLIAILIAATNFRKIAAYIRATATPPTESGAGPRRGRPSTRRSYLPNPGDPPLVTPAA